MGNKISILTLGSIPHWGKMGNKGVLAAVCPKQMFV